MNVTTEYAYMMAQANNSLKVNGSGAKTQHQFISSSIESAALIPFKIIGKVFSFIAECLSEQEAARNYKRPDTPYEYPPVRGLV